MPALAARRQKMRCVASPNLEDRCETVGCVQAAGAAQLRPPYRRGSMASHQAVVAACSHSTPAARRQIVNCWAQDSSSGLECRLPGVTMRQLLLALALLAAAVCSSHAQQDMSWCPGNLVVNGDFEQPNTELVPTELKDPSSNPRWGWYKNITGWYTTRPDGLPCARVDWQKPYIEIGRGALATPVQGKQYAELLPNGTGNYCQDVKLVKGQTYKLSYYYGRLMTYAKQTKKFTNYDTAVDVAIRPASYKPSPSAGRWPGDRQGYTVISSADTLEQFEKYQKQWVQHISTFTAPADVVTLAFINTKRPKECGSCGSLLDAVCLTKA